MSKWIDTTLGEAVVGDIIDHGVTYGRVASVEHTERPGGTVMLYVEGQRPIHGKNTDPCQVYR